MRARLVLVAVAIAAPLACSSSPPSGEPVAVVPTIVVPEDLIGQILQFSLQIYSTSGGIGCDTTTGEVTGDVTKAMPIASTGNISTTCPAGVQRCHTFTNVQFQTVPSVFSVIGFGPDGTTKLAVGCTQAMINQSSLDVNIKLVRVLPMANCGDGTVEPTETCDDSTPVCPPKMCQTVEELLSYGDQTNASTSTGTAGQKTNPFLLWNPGSNAAGAMLAVFTDASRSLTPSLQIGARLMDDTLSPPTLFGLATDGSAIYLPNCVMGCSTLPPPPAVNDEKQPSAASLGGNAYVVFSSDAPAAMSDAFDIYLGGFGQSSSLPALATCPVNTQRGQAATTYTSPSVAASGSALFVAWQDQNGNVSGRMVTPGSGCGTLGPETDNFGSGVGSSTTGAKVAAAANNGWAVVWPNGNTVQLQMFGSNGQTSGSPIKVGSGNNPQVAWDGTELAVAWAGTMGIQVQRYKGDGTVPSNATSDANTSTIVNTTKSLGNAPTPAIAGGVSTASVGFFTVSWISSTGVQARLINGASGLLTDNSGYLFNTVDGTANDFQVNVTATNNRSQANPTVAVGGNPGFIAFGWEDRGTTCPAAAKFPGAPCWGIVARRFPLPAN